MPSLLKEIPPGWTNDCKMIDYEHEWAADTSPGQQMAQDCDLPRAEPIMYHEDTAIGEVIFGAGDKFYLWTQVSGSVCEILCEDLNKIVEILNKRGLQGLKCKTVL